MALPTSSISFSQIRAEMRGGSNNPTYLPTSIPINDTLIGLYAFNPGVLAPGTTRSLGQARGASFTLLTVSTATISYNVKGAMAALGYTPTYRGTANVLITAAASFTTPGTGNFAFDTGSPWHPASQVRIVYQASGATYGKGGPGGNGGTSGGPGVPSATWTAGFGGTSGGSAFRATIPTTLAMSGGTIIAGGGGGGGGAGRRVGPALVSCGGGGGGGGGSSPLNPGVGGAGGSGGPYPGGTSIPGSAGSPNSGTSGGAGGTNTPQPAPSRAGIGGSGGASGSAGGSGAVGSPPALGAQGTAGPGGAAGYSIQGRSFITAQTPLFTIGPTLP